MTNPSNLVITGLDGYFILNFLQKSGCESDSVHLSADSYGTWRRTGYLWQSVLGKETDRTDEKNRCLCDADRIVCLRFPVFACKSFSLSGTAGFYYRWPDHPSENSVSENHSFHLFVFYSDADFTCSASQC